MTIDQVHALLESQKNQRGIAYWEKAAPAALKTFGLGLTQLKAIGKQIGKNHPLALELWKSPYYDAKTLATIIDDPKQVSEAQVEEQIKDADFWMLSYSYCSNLLAKTSFAQKKMEAWTASSDHLLRRCGYMLLYHLAKNDKKLPDAYFAPYLDTIEKSLQAEENFVKDAMNNALCAIGQRSKPLNTRAIAVVKKIGKVEVDYGDNSCQALDCYKHLTAERVQQRFANA